MVSDVGPTTALQHRLFVNDPWELMAEAIHRALPDGGRRDVAHSFRRQAEDYFRAATVGRELAVRPVLLYYAFLNLSKAYAIAKGNRKLTGKTSHGISAPPKPPGIQKALIKFQSEGGVFQEILRHLGGSPSLLNSPLQLGYLMPQILPGHRLWCYSTNQRERFLPVERFDILCSTSTKEVWLNLYLNKGDLDELRISGAETLSEADMGNEFELVDDPKSPGLICFQQLKPEPYERNPIKGLDPMIRKVRNKIWETVKVASPYRKWYIYLCPPAERDRRMPQILSVYLLMFFLSSVTRYSPGRFELLLESRYGPFFQTFVSESPTQFLYLMASEILGREVSKPAII
jgi:hypothetical protein